MGPFSETALKADLIRELESLFGVFPLAKLVELSPLIEDFVRQYMISAISDHISVLSDDGQSLGVPGRVRIGGASHRVSAAPDLWSQSTLLIALVAEEGPPSKRRPKSLPVKIDGVGRYDNVHIYIDPGIRLDRDKLSMLVLTVFQTGYSLLEETLIRALSDEEVSFSREIYS